MIANPLKLDARQRVSLIVMVSALAYFIAHTIHKAPPTSPQPDQRLGFLEQQMQSLQSQQQQLSAQAESKEKEKQRRQEIKAQLAVFLKEGSGIQSGLHYNNSTSLQDKVGWERRVEQYLSKSLDESYAVRFRSPSHQVSAYPTGMNRHMLDSWGEVTARMAMLNDFISELRD